MTRNHQNGKEVIRQAAVLAVYRGRICLVTSSSGKQWLLPKGHLERGHNLRDTAREEAWEEAGLVGQISTRPVGEYEYLKLGQVHRVVIFWMKVTQALPKWPECKRRRRRWWRPEQALVHISQISLRQVVDSALHDRRAA